MPRPEHFNRWCLAVGAAVFLCLALMTAGARASATPMQEMSASAVSPVAVQSMPMASDCRPCALCYVAPTPSLHAFTGEGKEPEPLTWWVHAEPTPAAVRFLTSVSRRDRVPIRVAFCRWLD